MTLGSQTAFSTCVFGGIICAYIAKKKGCSPGRWGAFGFFVAGPLAYIFIAVIVGTLAGFTSR